MLVIFHYPGRSMQAVGIKNILESSHGCWMDVHKSEAWQSGMDIEWVRVGRFSLTAELIPVDRLRGRVNHCLQLCTH